MWVFHHPVSDAKRPGRASRSARSVPGLASQPSSVINRPVFARRRRQLGSRLFSPACRAFLGEESVTRIVLCCISMYCTVLCDGKYNRVMYPCNYSVAKLHSPPSPAKSSRSCRQTDSLDEAGRVCLSVCLSVCLVRQGRTGIGASRDCSAPPAEACLNRLALGIRC